MDSATVKNGIRCCGKHNLKDALTSNKRHGMYVSRNTEAR